MNGGPLDEFGLTLKQRDFCLAYTGEAEENGTRAAKIARYDGDENTLAAIASENLTKPKILAYIKHLRAHSEAYFIGKIMSALEVKAGLTQFARADIADVFEADGTFNLQAAKKRGTSRLIRSMTFDKDTGRLTKLEMHNAHVAHVDMGKVLGIISSKVEVSSKELEDAVARAAAQFPAQIPLPPTFGQDDDAPVS